jgi:hypothetical protein
MRTVAIALSIFAAACGGSQKEHENPLVQGSDASPTCCCKTVPAVSEKEIVPNFALAGRMECSTQNGSCVDDVQCNGQAAPGTSGTNDNGVPPPPTIGGSASDPVLP